MTDYRVYTRTNNGRIIAETTVQADNPESAQRKAFRQAKKEGLIPNEKHNPNYGTMGWVANGENQYCRSVVYGDRFKSRAYELHLEMIVATENTESTDSKRISTMGFEQYFSDSQHSFMAGVTETLIACSWEDDEAYAVAPDVLTDWEYADIAEKDLNVCDDCCDDLSKGDIIRDEASNWDFCDFCLDGEPSISVKVSTAPHSTINLAIVEILSIQ